jgi:hypothetical protein
MTLIKLVFESLCRALIRFFDNRFIRDDDVEWYRMELNQSRIETQKLLDHFVTPKPVTLVTEDEDYQPITPKKFKSFDQKRKELEQASRMQAMKLADEARSAIEKSKTTAELEEELGIADNG